jgi:hypothetical protein
MLSGASMRNSPTSKRVLAARISRLRMEWRRTRMEPSSMRRTLHRTSPAKDVARAESPAEVQLYSSMIKMLISSLPTSEYSGSLDPAFLDDFQVDQPWALSTPSHLGGRGYEFCLSRRQAGDWRIHQCIVREAGILHCEAGKVPQGTINIRRHSV